jgi:glucuronate isomerase
MEIDFDELEGLSIQDKLVSLLHRLDREQELNQFVIWLENEKGKCVAAQIAVLSKEPAWELCVRASR